MNSLFVELDEIDDVVACKQVGERRWAGAPCLETGLGWMDRERERLEPTTEHNHRNIDFLFLQSLFSCSCTFAFRSVHNRAA